MLSSMVFTGYFGDTCVLYFQEYTKRKGFLQEIDIFIALARIRKS